jgi:oligopeptide transport system substrate-binding protein
MRLVAAVVLLAAAAVGAVAFAGRARIERADFVFTNGGEIASLDPHAVSGVPESRIVRALFEGLVSRDPKTLEVVPGVAAKWELDSTGVVYTFHLRDDARWSNGDPLTAADFEWSFRRLLEPETASPNASQLWSVVGARAFTTGRDELGQAVARDGSAVGIHALDALTLEIRLAQPLAKFLDVLACYPLVPVHRRSIEALRELHPRTWMTEWTQAQNLVTNGPFRLVERRLNDRIRLAKNELYWDAEHVAFHTIDALAVESWTTALNLYLTGEVDWVDGSIPPSAVPHLRGRADFKPSPYLGLYFYRINTTKPPLDDVRVRRALATSINRREVCDKVLKAGQQPAFGFVPWGGVMSYASPPGLRPNLDGARELLAQCGFDGEQRPFPTLELHYNTSEMHRDIAEVIAAQWKDALGIDVRLVNQEWKVFLDSQTNLDYDLSRSSWIADYQDPSTFLEIWTTGNENNRTGWSDAQYDALIAQARVERDRTKRNALYAAAEARLVLDAPAIPIYSYVSQNLVSPRLGGFYANALNEQFPKYWFWAPAGKQP